MPQIDARQLQSLSQARHSAFVLRLHAHLCRSYGTAWSDLVTPQAQQDFVQRLVTQAKAWGFEAESDIAELAMLVVEMRQAQGPAPMPPWFAQVVGDPSLRAPAKLHQLIARWHEQLAPRLSDLPGFERLLSGSTS